jgi:polyhydroxyalkanoate synthase
MPDFQQTANIHPHDTLRPPDMAALAALWQAWLPHPSAQPIEPLADAATNDPLLRGIDDLLNANPLHDVIPVDWGAIARALRMIASRSLAHPVETMFSVADLTMRAWSTTFNIWNDALAQWWGVPPPSPPAPSADKRFSAPDWTANPAFRTFKDLYQLASEWLLKQGDMPDLEPAQRQWVNFHLRQFVDAMSPALSPATNPEVLHRAVQTGGANFAEGARNLMHDLREGRLSMVDTAAFAPGRNLALSPGKVVYRNKLIELIQYAPTTETVHATPLLIIPPWINKFYILDMQPKNSLVRYLVSQGITVFMISWKNPDISMEDTTIEDYMELGPLAASDIIREITEAQKINVMGYCIGGTLLAMVLAWLTTPPPSSSPCRTSPASAIPRCSWVSLPSTTSSSR